MAQQRVADYIADFIAAIGVRQVFLLPGGGAMHLNDAVGKHPQLQVVACLHEQAAAISAEAYGRVDSSGIGVAMVTTGPGATNALTAVVGAWIESIPLLIISGQVKRADLLNGAPLRQRGVQEVDIVSMVRSVTKYAKTIEKAEDIRAELECALYHAHQGRGGPVWLDVPLDIQGAPIYPDTLQPFGEPQIETDSAAALSDQVQQFLSLLANAKRPLILAGHGVRLAGAAQDFRAMVEALGVPVVTTWNAMDLLAYEHPLYVGRPGVVALRAPNFAVQNCDLLIAIGCRLDNIITAYNPRGFARAAKKVVIDVDANEIAKLDMEIDVSVVADAAKVINEMLKQVQDYNLPDYVDWQGHCLDWKQRYPVNDGVAFEREGPITHYHFVDALSEAVPENTLVCTGSSGLAVEVFYTAFRNKAGQRIFLTSGLGAMGYGLPAAVGACFANHSQPMVLVESDGSLQLNIQELATVRAFDLPICIFIMNNGGYCSIRNTQRNYFEGRYVGTGPEAGLMLPDLEKVAQTYGLTFMRIKDALELNSALSDAMTLPRPCIIDVQLVENESLFPKVSAIPQADGNMVSMPLEDMTPLLPLDVLEKEMLIELLPASWLVRKNSTD